MKRAVIAIVLALGALAPQFAARPASASVPAPDGLAGEPGSPCVRPIVQTGASCTFNVWGHVRDADGDVIAATVRVGTNQATTNEQGFFDLYLPNPGSYTVLVESRPGCRVPLRVEVDAAAAIRDGGVRRDVLLPCTRPTYNAFGFAVVQSGMLVTVARTGVSHSGYAPGRIDWLQSRGATRAPPRSFIDTAHDDRDAAGGLTRSGAMVVFYAHFDPVANRWAGMRFVRAAREGSVAGVIGTGDLVSFSPYGPIVILPSGRLMQTFYGTDAHHVTRIYVSFSGDDGRTWSPIVPIDARPSLRANEAAAVYLDGATDARARILMVARADGYVRGKRWFGLVQYLSTDGGRSWRRQGAIASTSSRRESIPWLANLSGGRVAMVWTDRGTLTLKRSIARAADAVAMRWAPAQIVYRSRVPEMAHPDIGDFGYPSIASYGPEDSRKAIVFNDANPAGSVGKMVDVDLYAISLWASPATSPVTISP
ncbi:MAG TPA: hypothetical protein VGB64_13945 [Actinomycetota bacterium]